MRPIFGALVPMSLLCMVAQSAMAQSTVGYETRDVAAQFQSAPVAPPVGSIQPSNHAAPATQWPVASQNQCQHCQQHGGWYAVKREKGLFESDWEFGSFIEPVTNSILFEDPRAMTRLRFLFLNQLIPEDSVLRGGDLQVYALQATLAVNERLTLIANRDGYITLQPDAGPNAEGWADLGTGAKYALIRDVENQFILTAGFMYEWTQGSNEVFQGNGEGQWDFFLTAGKKFNDFHFIGAVGWQLPVDSDAESESIFWSWHLDYQLSEQLYVLTEMTGFHYVDDGNAIPGLNQEGRDLVNLGAGNVSGNSAISWAWGAAIRPTRNTLIAAAYEIPLGREDLFEERLTINVSLFY